METKEKRGLLGPHQRRLLRLLALHGPQTVHELRARMKEPLPHYVTVHTILSRMETRGLVTHSEEGRVFRWKATHSFFLDQREACHDLVEGYFGGDWAAATTFVGRLSAALCRGDGGYSPAARNS